MAKKYEYIMIVYVMHGKIKIFMTALTAAGRTTDARRVESASPPLPSRPSNRIETD